MSKKKKKKRNIRFDEIFDDGRIAHCWQAAEQGYLDMTISSGLVEGIEPDNYYLKFDRDGEEPTTLFLREDEALAVLFVLSGALWSTSIFGLERN
jgi:hypothetical protein